MQVLEVLAGALGQDLRYLRILRRQINKIEIEVLEVLARALGNLFRKKLLELWGT